VVRKLETSSARQTWLVTVLIVVLLANSLMLGRSLNLFRLPGERNTLAMAKETSNMLISYIERWASEQGLGGLPVVQDLVARLQYDIGRARTLEELAQVMLNSGAQAIGLLDMERDAKRREVLQVLVNNDPAIPQVQQKVSILISNESGDEVTVVDRARLLSAHTIDQIKGHPLCNEPFDEVVIEISEGKARAVNYRTLYDQVKVLQQETQNLQAELRRLNTLSGYASMTGPGLVVELYDAPGAYNSGDIVHDADIRDVVNELFAAGAVGIAVGDQRLTTTSSVRCVGPSILVNQKQIVVNPVRIQAVGDPDVLYSSMDIMVNTLRAMRGIEIVLEKQEEIVLPAATTP